MNHGKEQTTPPSGWIQTLFLCIRKSLNIGISTTLSDSPSEVSQESKKVRSRDRRIFEKNQLYELRIFRFMTQF